MASTSIDRLTGLSSGVAIKASCRAATTANITLFGEQTIDGVAVVAGNRVLVKDQTNTAQNGIYDASATAWTRAVDFDGPRDVRYGTLVPVNLGTANGATLWSAVTSVDPPVIDTSTITFTQFAVSTNSGTFSGNVTARAFIPNNATVPTNGMYLSAANTVSIAANTTRSADFTSTGLNNTVIGATTPAAITATLATANRFVPNNSTLPTDGVYLPAANTVGIAARSLVAATFTNPASAVNYWAWSGSATSSKISGTATGTDTDIGINFISKGTGSISFLTNGGSQKQVEFIHTANAVNYLGLTGAVTGTGPAIRAFGSDTNIHMAYSTKGNGLHVFYNNDTAGTAFSISQCGALPANYLEVAPNISGLSPSLSALGSDTNIDITLGVKGTGKLKCLGVYNATSGSGANVVVDSSGYLYRATSSMRFKEDVRDYNIDASLFDGLRPVLYKSKLIADGKRDFAGFIAEEIADLGLEELITRDKAGKPDSILYPQVTALIAAEVKSLRARVSALEVD